MTLATEYIYEYWHAAGLNPIKENFDVRGWEFNSFSFYNETKGEEVVGAECQYFSGSVDFVGKLHFVDEAMLERLEVADVSGKVCYIDTMKAGGVLKKNVIAKTLEDLGALGVIFIASDHLGNYPSTKTVRSPHIEKIACVAVTPLAAAYIKQHKDDTFALKIDAKPYDTKASNVSLTLGEGAKRITLGAHSDAAPLIQGASDNASGTAILLELAKLVKESGIDLDGFTLEFSTFNAEEYIPTLFAPGSEYYLKTRWGENIVCYLNLDDIGINYATPSILLYHSEKIPDINYPYPTEIREKEKWVGDEKPFTYSGIPAVFFTDKKHFGGLIHTKADTVQFLSYEKMEKVLHDGFDVLLQLLSKY